MAETQPPAPTAASQGSTYLQWFRELVTALIAIVILWLAGATLYGTWSAASHVETDKEKSAAQKDAYERQKDVMLYTLALLGTVTGYYLGRVPAEMHAQQAQRAATSAQQQLQATQNKLTDAAGTAATASDRAAVAEKAKQEVQRKADEARSAIENAQKKMAKAVADMEQRRAAVSPHVSAMPTGGPPDTTLDDLKSVWQEMDRVLQRMQTPPA